MMNVTMMNLCHEHSNIVTPPLFPLSQSENQLCHSVGFTGQPGGQCFHSRAFLSNHCGASAQRQINNNPLVIPSMHCGNVSLWLPPLCPGNPMQTYFPDQGCVILQLYNISSDPGTQLLAAKIQLPCKKPCQTSLTLVHILMLYSSLNSSLLCCCVHDLSLYGVMLPLCDFVVLGKSSPCYLAGGQKSWPVGCKGS